VSATAGDTNATVTWNPSVTTATAAVASYTVTASPGGASATTANGTTTVAGLANNTAYSFTVVANSASGPSAPSAPSNSVTPIAALPDPPTAVVAYAGNGQAEVTWTAPVHGGTTPIDRYAIIAYPATGPAIGLYVICGWPCNSGVMTGLTNGVSYTFVVYAHNLSSSGFSTPAGSNALTPNANPGPYPVIADFASPGNGDAYVTWSAPITNGGSAVNNYLVQAYDFTSGTAVYVNFVYLSASTTSTIFPGLINGHSYAFVVNAGNPVSYTGVWTGQVTPSATPWPFPVANLIAMAADTAVVLHWDAPSTGPAPTGYEVYQFDLAASGQLTLDANYHTITPDPLTNSLRTFDIVGGLNNSVNGSGYVYAVQALGANGASVPAPAIVAPPARLPASPPNYVVMPSSLLNNVLNPSAVQVAPGDMSAVVSFNATVVGGLLASLGINLDLVAGYSVNVYKSPAGTTQNSGGTLVGNVAVTTVLPSSSCSTGSPSDPPQVGPVPGPCVVINASSLGGTPLVNGTSYYFEVVAKTAVVVPGGAPASTSIVPAGKPFPRRSPALLAWPRRAARPWSASPRRWPRPPPQPERPATTDSPSFPTRSPRRLSMPPSPMPGRSAPPSTSTPTARPAPATPPRWAPQQVPVPPPMAQAAEVSITEPPTTSPSPPPTSSAPPTPRLSRSSGLRGFPSLRSMPPPAKTQATSRPPSPGARQPPSPTGYRATTAAPSPATPSPHPRVGPRPPRRAAAPAQRPPRSTSPAWRPAPTRSASPPPTASAEVRSLRHRIRSPSPAGHPLPPTRDSRSAGRDLLLPPR